MLTRMVALASSIALIHALVSPIGAVATPQGRHCAYRLEASGRASGHVVHASAVLVGCFSTFARALHEGSNGSIVVPSETKTQSLTDATLAASSDGRPRGGSVLIGTEFNLTGYTGESNSYFAPDTCQGNTYEVSPLPGAWDDRLESGKGFGGCDHNKKFAGPSFGGDSITCTPNCNTYGSLNNEVSSLRWRP